MITRYGYSSCNEGWDWNNGICKEHICSGEYVALGGVCPKYADCESAPVCLEGNDIYTNFVCVAPRQKEGNKCVLYLTGSIYEQNGVPIGVVFDDDGDTTKIVALTDVKSTGDPGSATMAFNACNITGLEGYNNVDGTAMTTMYLENCPEDNPVAATAARAYAPDVCKDNNTDYCNIGHWSLPAQEEMNNIYYSLIKINNNINVVGGSPVQVIGAGHGGGGYWTTWGESNNYMYIVSLVDGSTSKAQWRHWKNYVRPILVFKPLEI